MLWNQLAGTSKPPTERAVCLSANRFIDPPACSKPIQKKMENIVRMQMAMMRCHSLPVRRSLPVFSLPANSPGPQMAAAITSSASTTLAAPGSAENCGPTNSAR